VGETLPGDQPAGVDIVIPVYNEEGAVVELYHQLNRTIDTLSTYNFRILFVNDGSTDATQAVLMSLAENDERVTVLELSRNFGHQAALTAGLDICQGDYVITMDGDGQHPPSLLPEMLDLARSGYDIVVAQRIVEHPKTFKNLTSNGFYRLVNLIGDTHIQPGAADFRLMKRPVVDSLKTMREYHRLLRGMVSWMGYRSVVLPYRQPDRLQGKSKYSLAKMLRLAIHAIFSFSLGPLYLGISLGVLFLFLAMAEVVYVLSFWISGNQASLAPGWSSLMFVLLCVGGSLMVMLGFVGIYTGFIFQEVKRRPVYLIRNVTRGGWSRQGSKDPYSEQVGEDQAER
jgi:dolichol-phosphate mannosyltransferase